MVSPLIVLIGEDDCKFNFRCAASGVFSHNKIKAANSLLKVFCFSINRSLEVNKEFPGDGSCIQGEELPNLINSGSI